MLQGNRWQLLALFVSIIVFAAVLMTRGSDEPAEPNPEPTAQTTSQALETAQPESSETSVALPEQPTPELAAAATNDEGDGIVTYREGLVGSVNRLNPLLAGFNPAEADITALIFEGLTRIDEYGTVLPNLAESWVVSADGLEYVFTLRSDILWQDGVPFSVDDVVYTIDLLSDPLFPGPEDLATFWSTVETQKISDRLLRFRLAQPLASFPEALRIGMLPYHALQGTGAAQLATHPFNVTPIGTGPYQIEALRGQDGRIQMVDLRVAPNYRLRPEGQTGYALERLRFQLFDTAEAAINALRQGQIDAYATRSQWERNPLLPLGGQVTLHTGYEPSIGFMIFNWANDDFPVFREERVRAGLYLGVDQESIVARNMLNLAVPANSPLLPISWAYDGNLAVPGYDPVGAADILSRAVIRGEADPEAGVLFRFSILTPDDPALVAVANAMAGQWSALNIPRAEGTARILVTVDAVDAATYAERINSGDFQAAIVELSKAPSADPDVYAFWHQGQYPEGQNLGGANDRRVSEALERARRDSSGTNRAIHYERFQQAFIDRAIAIPLYYPLLTYAVVPNISGVQIGFIGAPSDRFNTIRNWRIEG